MKYKNNAAICTIGFDKQFKGLYPFVLYERE